MDQNVRKPGQRQLLGQVRALCVGWKISEAKHILLKEAKLNEDASFINYDEIRRSAKNKTLPLMRILSKHSATCRIITTKMIPMITIRLNRYPTSIKFCL